MLAFLQTQAPALQPRAGADASCTSRSQNDLVVAISSQVLISDYSHYYHATPIAQFHMSYTQVADGSLLAPPFTNEIRESNWFLLFVGMMLMLFLRNAVGVSVSSHASNS